MGKFRANHSAFAPAKEGDKMTRKVACFTLTEDTAKKMHGKGYMLICSLPKCQKPLKAGDKIVSRRKGGKLRTQHFHECCWEDRYL